MFLAIKEKRFAKRIIKRLLKSHSIVNAGDSELSGQALYREILLHAEHVDSSRVDQVLQQAEDSIDSWTTSDIHRLGFRHVVHFVVMSQYRAAGNIGTVISFRDIVYSMIPAEL
jgi:hypothetical protein